MRKVSKMALVFVAIASFVCFLFYKWRYDKLYSVLEVLEFFGNDNSLANNGFVASRSRLQHPPAWQRLSNGTFAYSAHCSRTPGSNDLCPAVTILSISSLQSVNDLHNKLTCQLWYDSSIQPISVPISVAPALSSSATVGEYQTFLLTCESKFAAVLPFGVSLGLQLQEGEKWTPYLHVESPFHDQSVKKETNVAACISPQEEHVDSTLPLLENVLLHYYFGVSQFFIYDNGVTNKFIEALSDPPSDVKLSKLNIAILPWNLPFPLHATQVQSLVETDCHLRSRAFGFASNFVVKQKQIMVPKSGAKNIPDALDQSQKSGQLLVDVLKFCSEYPEENKYKHEKSIKALQQSIYNAQMSQGFSTKITHKSGGSQHRISHDELAVHDYSDCHNYDMDVNGPESIHDRSVSRQSLAIESFMGKFFPSREK